MLTRRGFTGFASCAICGLAEFVATEASAQGAPPATSTPGVTRKILSQMDGPAPGYVTITAIAEIKAEPSKVDFKVLATYIVEKDKPLASPA